jgi:hypothetical protein
MIALAFARSSRAALALACAGMFFAACHGSTENVMPEAPLAEDTYAQAEYRTLRAAFFDAEGPARAKLVGRLGDFLKRFPTDPRTFDVEVYLVWARLESGDRQGARAVLEPLLKGEEGPRLDFARVTQAALLARSGEPERALAEFDVLEGKLVDVDERFVYGQERARASFMAGAYERGIEALLSWLVQAPPDRQSRARTMATELLRVAPSADLVRALAVLRRGASGVTTPDLEAARGWVASTIARQLTDVALARSDSELARRLLDAAPATLRATPEGQRLVALAAAVRKAAVVAGRALGVLLSLNGSVEQRRASAVAAGLTRALGTLRLDKGGSGIDLLVRYDTEDVDAALGALAADGAALFVAGNDDPTASAAAARAEALHVPILLLRAPPESPSANGYTFVLGAADEGVEQELIHALDVRGRHNLGRIGPGGTSCSVEPTTPGGPRFPLASFRKSGIDGLLVLGDADCARDLAAELEKARDPLLLALGLDAGGIVSSLGPRGLTVAARAQPKDGAPGGWYESLGHDAGVLAARALSALPSEGVARQGDVEVLHARARDALATAEADLWTSERRGFAGSRVLAREFTIVTGGSAP